jgi:hypothetical protein
VVLGNGFARLDVSPVVLRFDNPDGGGGAGRIRIDTLDRTRFPAASVPSTSATFGKVMFAFPPVQSRLSIISAAGQEIPEGTNSSVTVMLPFGSDTNQVIRVQARDFAGIVPINVVITPQNGPRRIFPAQIDMTLGNPAFANVNVTIPINTEAVINAWTQ